MRIMFRYDVCCFVGEILDYREAGDEWSGSIPEVFISYSYDSNKTFAGKRWVRMADLYIY